MKELISEVREARKGKAFCLSAEDGIDIKYLLERIIAEETYRKDYEENTSKLLYENVGYDEAIVALCKISSTDLF